MPASWNRNRLTSKLGIDYPIIQGPFGGFSSQRLTAAVSNFGGLGSFGAHGLEPEAIKDVLAQIRSLTSKPFAMNLWVSMEDEGARTSDESDFNRSLAPLASYLAALGEPRPAYKPYLPIRFEDQARVLLDAKVPAFNFIYGIPPREILEECRAKGIVTIVRRQHAMRPQHFTRPAWMRSPVPASKPVIAVHSSGPQRIPSWERFR
jgi:nitronate monooxygenase